MHNYFRLFAIVVLSLAAFLSVSWAGLATAGIFAALFVAALWVLSGRGGIRRMIALQKARALAYTLAAFFVFANMFVFSATLFPRHTIVFFLGGAALFVVLGAHLSVIHEDRRAAESIVRALLVFFALLMEMVFMLQFLPYGYLTLAAIALIWYATMIALYDRYMRGTLGIRKTGEDIAFAAILTVIAALSSGIRPR